MCEVCEKIEKELGGTELEQLEALEVQNNSNEIILPPIELPFEYFEDSEDFQRGVKDAMYMAGFITTIANTGISSVEALGYLLNKDTIEMNIKLSEINRETSIEVSKNQLVNLEKQQL
jgi:hypothetical protein